MCGLPQDNGVRVPYRNASLIVRRGLGKGTLTPLPPTPLPPLTSSVSPHMQFFRMVGILSACYAVMSCGGFHSARGSAMARCVISDAAQALVQGSARGVRLELPSDAKGPSYDSDDYYASRPTWTGEHWRAHFVYGNGGLTEFMKGDRCCSLDDEAMHRRVCVGNYMYYGAMADISRIESPDKVSSVQVTIEPNGLSEGTALSVIASVVTNWEHQ